MGIVVDIILIAIIGLNVYLGYKKGLIKVAFNVFAFLIAIIATIILFKPVSSLVIKNTPIDDKIEETFIKNFSGNQDENSGDKENNESSNFVQKYISDTVKDATTQAKDNAVKSVAKTVALRLTEIITAIALFILIRILIIILSFLSDMIAELPIVKQFNEAGGIIYGLLKSVIIIYFILTIIFIISSIKGNGIITNTIEQSFITKFLYNNNVVVKYCLLNKNLL